MRDKILTQMEEYFEKNTLASQRCAELFKTLTVDSQFIVIDEIIRLVQNNYSIEEAINTVFIELERRRNTNYNFIEVNL